MDTPRLKTHLFRVHLDSAQPPCPFPPDSMLYLLALIGEFRYFEHWAPFLGGLGWNGVVDYWSCLGYMAHLELPLTISEWLARGIHKPVLKSTLNFRFQKCATHRVVSGVCWCIFSFCSVLRSSVGLEPSQKSTTKRKQPPFLFPVNEQWVSQQKSMGFTKCQIKQRQKVYFTTILDLKYQWTPLTHAHCTFLKNKR